jgi:hypothetical protein
MRLALADAFHFRRVQRIDFGTALVVILLQQPSRPRQQALQHDRTEQVGVAMAFAAHVADDAAEVGSKLL